ncbi:hypothetical protein ACJIZ3_024326 [Penstemon smallii]|uniref:Beta-galactosidase n=1 Tax=Penstemon smallii TaxID=265156 RepID=A0ABD3TRP6_9LAMI
MVLVMDYSFNFFLLALTLITFNLLNTGATEVTYDGKALKIDGERKIIISGSIHYPRSTPEMWPDLIKKSKEGGLNAIETYVFWNAHEPLYRQNEMKNFTNVIVDMVKQAKLFAPQGGPIILAQIENEYGNIISSYGEEGKSYINWCANFAESLNVGVPWIMFKTWGGHDPHRSAEDLAFSVARFYQYGGTLQNYYMYHGGTNFGRTSGVEKVITNGDVNTFDYGRMMSTTVFSYNGTRVCFFGNGNNQDNITFNFEGKSYTVPSWSVTTKTTTLVKNLPPEAQTRLHYNFEWKWRAESLNYINTHGNSSSPLKGVTYTNKLIDQNLVTNDTSDYLWYMTSVNIDEKNPIWGKEVTLQANTSCHVLHAYFNGEYIGSQWVKNGQYYFVFEKIVKLKLGTNKIALLSATVGLQNYGAFIDRTPTGILGPVKLIAPNNVENDLSTNEWAYKVGLDGMVRELGSVTNKGKKRYKWRGNIPVNQMFVWYKTNFRTPAGNDSVVLDLYGLGKGTTWVNGHNIGRYWPSFISDENGCTSTCDYRGAYTDSKCMTNCGKSSQRWYHVPRSFLNQEDNTLVLFEEIGGNPNLAKEIIVVMDYSFQKILCALTIITFYLLNTYATEVTYDGRALKINGERKIIISGSIHYPRSTPEMWPDLIKKSKEGGLNAIETYVFWNAHEPLYRQNEMKNFTTVIADMVKQEQLFASEGGPIILAQIENEYGNVISSYGNDGKSYINWCANFAESISIGVPWIMYKDWGGQDPHRTAEDLAFAVGRFFQYGGTLQNYYMYHGGTNFGRVAGGPYITTSYDYDAPLDEYGNLNQPKWGHLKNLHSLIMSMEKVLTYGEANNTDYGRMMSSTVFSYNGTRVCFFGNANNQDDITINFEGRSYAVPSWSVSVLPDCVTEVYNTAKVTTQTTIMVKELPAEAKPRLHYDFEWKWRAEQFEHLKSHGNSSNPLNGVTYANKLIDQKLVTNDTSDYLWYLTNVDIDENDPIRGEQVSLQVNCTCHVLHVFFNGKHIGSQWVKNGQYSFVFERDAKLKQGTNIISLLSVTVGLQNYGAFFDKTANGILGPVKLVAPNSVEKDLSSNEWGYKVGLKGVDKGLENVDIEEKKHKWYPNIPINRMFVWYKTNFKTPKGKDAVVLDLYGSGKGMAWVNGRDIGRYWPSFISNENGCSSSCDYRGAYYASKCLTNCGKSSQRWYHVPRSFLNEEDNNTLVLFEECGGNPKLASVQIVTMK